MSLVRGLRQTLTIARRDFIATVFTPTFLLFLLAPVLMVAFGVLSSIAGQSVVGAGAAKVRMVAIAAPDRAATLTAVDGQLRTMFPATGDNSRPPLRIESPSPDVTAQVEKLFERTDFEVAAVLYGPLERPTIRYAPRGWSEGSYLAQLAEQTLRAERSGTTARMSVATMQPYSRGQASSSGRGAVAYFSVVGIFILTLFLSGQAVGTMAEERSNKVIEVLAAAIPLESVFLGKLIGMFGSAVLFILFWGTLLSNLSKVVPGDYASMFADLGPAVGYPAFPLLFLGYFTMSYMLLGAVFLSVGALTSTQRELQMLSLPITILQFGMFGFAGYAVAHPDSWLALAAEIFPLSSPLAMIGHAANSPTIWPHALALAWQAVWVGIVITVGARLFRRGVLKSGSPKRLKSRPAA